MLSDVQRNELVSAAQSAAESAYSPFSKYRVGASVLCSNGKIYSGCNVENSSYGLTICAERVAVFKAVSSGERIVKAVCVATPDDESGSMCGACRQVVNEFIDENCEVVYVGRSGKVRSVLFRTLLPEPFRLKT